MSNAILDISSKAWNMDRQAIQVNMVYSFISILHMHML